MVVHHSHVSNKGWSYTKVKARTNRSAYLEDYTDNMIIFSRKVKISPYLNIISDSLSNYQLVKLKVKQLKYLEQNGYNPMTLKKFVNSLDFQIIDTNMGLLSFKDIKEYANTYAIYVHRTDIKETKDYLETPYSCRNKNDDRVTGLYIPLSKNEEFELLTYLKYHNVNWNKQCVDYTNSGYCYKCGSGLEDFRTKEKLDNMSLYVNLRTQDEGLRELWELTSRASRRTKLDTIFETMKKVLDSGIFE
jgi:hypothetical protein